MPGADFVEHVLELLAPLGAVRARPMMGGHIVHLGALPIALVYDDRLYLKADVQTQGEFAGAGCEPFTYARGMRVVAMSFWSAPDVALDDPEAMVPWARLAREAAARSRRPSPQRPPRAAGRGRREKVGPRRGAGRRGARKGVSRSRSR